MEFGNDKLSKARNPFDYITQLIDDVQKISSDVSREKERESDEATSGDLDDPRRITKFKDRRGSIWNQSRENPSVLANHSRRGSHMGSDSAFSHHHPGSGRDSSISARSRRIGSFLNIYLFLKMVE